MKEKKIIISLLVLLTLGISACSKSPESEYSYSGGGAVSGDHGSDYDINHDLPFR